MALKHLAGLDHVVILVRQLDKAAESWSRLGFMVSPRGTHSGHLGSANHTIMLGPDYIELLGILTETPHNAPSRAFLERRGEGMERVAFTATNAAACVEEIHARGCSATGPIDFGRPVTLPNGAEMEARFRVFHWPAAAAPANLRIFACQHLTREAVWIPELQTHANTASHIGRIEILSLNPSREADHMAVLIDSEVRPEPDGAYCVPSGVDRAALVFLARPALAARYPGVALEDLPEEGGASLVLVVKNLEAATRAVGGETIRTPSAVCVPPSDANGIMLAFQEKS